MSRLTATRIITCPADFEHEIFAQHVYGCYSKGVLNSAWNGWKRNMQAETWKGRCGYLPQTPGKCSWSTYLTVTWYHSAEMRTDRQMILRPVKPTVCPDDGSPSTGYSRRSRYYRTAGVWIFLYDKNDSRTFSHPILLYPQPPSNNISFIVMWKYLPIAKRANLSTF